MATVAASFGPMPWLTASKLGYGAGKSDTPVSTNLLRVTIGDLASPGVGDQVMGIGGKEPTPITHITHQPSPDEEWVTLIETNLDDVNPQYFDYVMERLIGHGALEVFLLPAQMMKNRPAVVLSVLCRPEQVDDLAWLIFEETAAQGLRISDLPRRILKRDAAQVETPYGPVEVKVASNPEGQVLHVKPEYDDAKRIAQELNVPIDRVYEEARRAWNPSLIDGHQRIGRYRNVAS
jgi:uncharacterized protein (DUF111 family)